MLRTLMISASIAMAGLVSSVAVAADAPPAGAGEFTDDAGQQAPGKWAP